MWIIDVKLCKTQNFLKNKIFEQIITGVQFKSQQI